jgi:beta-mannanase
VVRRRRVGVAGAGALAVLVLATTACGPGKTVGASGPHGRAPSPAFTATLSPATPGQQFDTTGRGPEPPAGGVWFGAYADPYNQTVTSKVSAINAFEQQIGRKVAIVHSFHPWTDDVPSAFDYDIVQNGQVDLLSWAGTDTMSMASGVYDAQIRRTAIAVRDMDKPILLRFRWEAERPNLAAVVHSPAAYIAAWKHVRSIFTSVGATNAGFVWCPLATGFANGTAQAYYPGDSQVDWICADLYPGDAMTSFASLIAPVMAFAMHHPRPVIIGELGVEAQPTNARAAWFTQMAKVIKAQPQIKALVYFNTNHRSRPFTNYTMPEGSADLTALKTIVNSPYFAAMPQSP